MNEESLSLVALGRKLKEQPPESLCWVIPHFTEVIFLKQSTPFQVASGWEALAPSIGITLPLSVLSQGAEYRLRLYYLFSLATKAVSGSSETLADPPVMLEKDDLSVQPGSFCIQTGPEEGVTYCDCW